MRQSPIFDVSERQLTDLELSTLRAIFDDRAPVFLLGWNIYARSLIGSVNAVGIIDDYKCHTTYDGLPGLTIGDTPKDALVISCVVEAHPITALRNLWMAGISRVVEYRTILRMHPGSFAPVIHLEGSREDVGKNLAKYESLYMSLADDRSRDVLKRVVEFRCGGDIGRMEGFTFDPAGQYFEDFVRLEDGAVFIDGGGFEGETTERFIERCPGYGGVKFFEPSAVALEKARQRLSTRRNIECFAYGLYERDAELRFHGLQESASRLSDDGDVVVTVVALDEAVREPISFLKLDVEGSECAALQGATRHIRESHPTLAVCVYHDQADFWRVPQIVAGMRADYDIYLRHYTEGVLETVMYFIPRQ